MPATLTKTLEKPGILPLTTYCKLIFCGVCGIQNQALLSIYMENVGFYTHDSPRSQKCLFLRRQGLAQVMPSLFRFLHAQIMSWPQCHGLCCRSIRSAIPGLWNSQYVPFSEITNLYLDVLICLL